MTRQALAALALALAAAGAQAQPAFAEVRAAHRPSDLLLVDRQGEPLQALRTDPTVRRGPWVPLAEASQALQRALIASEDRRFHEHAGIDWAAVAQAGVDNLVNGGKDGRIRGASTLTMQLAGLLDEQLARPSGGRSAWQKLGQAVLATRLELRWSKPQILEAYLNAVPFRGEVVGIHALSHALFGKLPHGLDAQESAVAVALVRGPNASPDRVGERACGVLKLQQLPCDGVRTLAAQALARRPAPAMGPSLAPHYARLALRPDGPERQRSTLDAGTQRVALQALAQQLAELQGRNVEDGAVVVLDNASGEVLAWVGANGRSSGAAQVDGVLARRQPGSTLKPFVYGLALEQRLLTAASLLDDAPTEIAAGAGLYLPQNYDRRFKGPVSLRTALGASLNIPAVRVGAMLSPDALHARLNALGLELKESAGWYGASLALGSGEVTLLALTNAYRTLARGGLHAPPALPGKAAAASRRVLEPGAAWIVADILADNNARALTFGLDSTLRTRGHAAVKTGTSKDLRDNWCIGFTDRYTVGVWVGNASGEPMHDVSGVSGAAPVWAAVVAQLHRDRPSRAPAAPAALVQTGVRFDGAAEPPRSEWFLAGTQPAPGQAVQLVAAARRAHGIRSPLDGAIYAIDPDIPPEAQRIRFEGEGGTWVLGGRRIGQGTQLSWLPRAGRHELALVDARGQTLQRVRFEVRGLALPRRRQGTG